MSKFWTAPRVFISYKWQPAENKDRVLAIAEKLRDKGIDVRIDVYFQQNLHGFSSPQPALADPRNAWIVWAENEIRQADCVLLFCTDQYTATYANPESDDGYWINWQQLPFEAKIWRKVPFVWWDWHTMYDDWKNGKATPSKYIPVGFGSYGMNESNIPAFLEGTTYYNLDSERDFTGLLRRIKTEHRRMHPRAGIFISYAHQDDPIWIDTLLDRLAPIENAGVKIWTDRVIEPGDRWHDEIMGSLSAAKIAILLVSPNFLSSKYITEHELPNFIEAKETDGLKLLWIPIEHSNYEETELEKIQAVRSPKNPLSALESMERDRAFDDIVLKIAAILGIEPPRGNYP